MAFTNKPPLLKITQEIASALNLAGLTGMTQVLSQMTSAKEKCALMATSIPGYQSSGLGGNAKQMIGPSGRERGGRHRGKERKI